jgi:hypothetical protein
MRVTTLSAFVLFEAVQLGLIAYLGYRLMTDSCSQEAPPPAVATNRPPAPRRTTPRPSESAKSLPTPPRPEQHKPETNFSLPSQPPAPDATPQQNRPSPPSPSVAQSPSPPHAMGAPGVSSPATAPTPQPHTSSARSETGSVAAGQPTSGRRAAASPPAAARAPNAFSIEPSGRPVPHTVAKPVPRPDPWRYIYEEGRWWYWSPQRQWLYYEGNRWHELHPQTPVADSAPAWAPSVAQEECVVDPATGR